MTTMVASEKSVPRRHVGVLALAAAALLAVVSVGVREVQADSEPVSAGGPPTFRRLDEQQYKRSIAQIFGPAVAVPGRFEPPVREDGLLAIGESKVVVTPAGLEQYAIRAREISAQVLSDKNRATYLQCGPAAPASFDDACARQFFGKYGRLLYRRPLSIAEMASELAVARAATKIAGDFHKGLEAGLTRLLVSPAFVFRLDRTEADPAHPGARRHAYSLATRISFLLWDAPPDAALLDAAESGALQTEPGLRQQVDRMMASPRLEDGVRAFFADMFAFDLFSGLSKDPQIFPVFNPQLRADAEEQTLRTIVDHLLTRRGDYRDLFTTRNTFLTRSLGAVYGVPVDYRAFGGGWMPYTFPENSPHRGILTLPAFLMLDASHEGRSSPTIRGKAVRENFLCQQVPSPPANVNFSIVQDTANPDFKTARDRLIAHQDNPVCAGCHKITDPIGLALENYDPVGRYRTLENGATIDASGELDGTSYKDALQLMNLLRDSPSAPACVVQRAFEYGIGRQIAQAEEPWLEYLGQRFALDGYKFPELLRDIATSQAFQAVAIEAPAPKTPPKVAAK